jgi:hypothetical protein
MNFCLDNVFVIPSSKLWSINRHQAAIKISDALKCKGGIPLLSLCAIVVTRRAICPFHMDNIHGANTAWQTNSIIIYGDSVQLGQIARQQDILILHVNHCIEKTVVNLRTFKVLILQSALHDQNAAPLPKRYSADITSNLECSQNLLLRQCNLGGSIYL